MENRITYHWESDYQIPDIVLSDSPNAPPIGRYGRLRRAFLREHRPILYSHMLLSETLFPHLREIDVSAQTRLDSISDREQAHEIICADLIYD
jgi:hypothetical protein